MGKVESGRERELCPGVASAPDWQRPGLSARARRVAAAIAEALLCDAGETGLSAPPDLCQRSVEGFDRAVGAASPAVRFGMHGLLELVEWLPPLVSERMARLSSLPLAERVRYLAALENAKFPLFNMLFVAVKIPLTLCAYEEGHALRLTGFDRADTTARRGKLPLVDRLGGALHAGRDGGNGALRVAPRRGGA